uniref:Ribulose bisphosphate carboxylase small subunit, chloroplastic n=2 Tax=Euglena gracilis TaxID=3039 RepID=RBS_EUGGR|nr:RecName: Full=Ribulose bisphosphate carboxylase small subunit, chloroplastic; Short=RuBisCO small subunit; Contains: RecName: Full=Ribulose bisphosphate carboxylase small chain P1, chloroplastic; Contains: RecName: Full=Ribulose bisphosphate carboxylase small chain P2, chloroplastic; Contains: RecName: Full=Ribulose bisphosphate carboxylase small chain P3, chloroplastic; Contains: RecName: Full=Ribulose bisphosphate carboxylase small chain P4, chloroplastic; Contains: RecName: Full=Ribulose bisp
MPFDRQPLLSGEKGMPATSLWLVGGAVIAAVCVIVNTSYNGTQLSVTARPIQAAVSQVSMARFAESGVSRGSGNRVSQAVPLMAASVGAESESRRWVASAILFPLSGLFAAVALKMAMMKPKVAAVLPFTSEKDMKVWNPVNNKKFETFSYLPPLSDAQIAKQVDMIIAKGLSPCLEFAAPENSFIANDNTVRFSGTAAGYYDNRYWTMWKLPMFGCTDASQVLREISECRRAYPQCYVRLAAFDSVKQVQVISFVVQRPSGSSSSSWGMAAMTGEKDMKVWNPVNNKKFETFSYLPPLSDAQIAKQVDMIIAKGLSPCLEFAAPENSFIANDNTVRFSGTAAGYYDNRYWTMWKLPMFGCTDASQVLREISECRRAYPQCYVRLAAFDSVKQVQVISFVVQRPSGSSSSWGMAAMTGEKDMKVWNPVNNKKFETFSYLPPLSDAQIAKQVDMIIAKGLSPCLEFAAPENSFIANDNTVRFSGTAAGYYDNHYWTMWKLPMFGCTDASQVLREISECRRAYPQCYVRLAAFDSVKQVQVISFVVQRPSGSSSSSWGMAAMTGEKDMKVWNPVNNKKFETFSYLPPLSDAQIAKQVDMIIAKGLSPCLEFAAPENSFIANDNTVRFSGTAAGYYDNRYWTMWKLPMFGCTDASQVLREISECRRAYPQCYVRLAAFDSVKQVQVISFVVQRPSGSSSSWGMAAMTGEKDMKVWNPVNNKKFETFSYLPPLSDAQIAKQVDMIIAKGLSPCLEFAAPENSFIANDNTVRFSGTAAGYYDNRYWTMWKLPMFGCTDASQVLREISECRRAYPQCYVRLAAFDSVKQVQVISFVVQRPSGSSSSSSWGMAAMTGEKEMKVWNPVNNKKFETFSYLPPLSDAQIAKQVDMIIAKGLSPCLEFAAPENSFIANDNTVRFSGTAAGYYDNRYWTMWKLPMFGCTDASQVLREISECRRAYPQCYVRLAFDSVKQVQVISFVVQRPSGSSSSSWGMAAMTGEKDMKVWNPVNNKKFETFSYLPPLSDAQIAKQVDMIIAKGLSPCLEFAAPENSFIANDNTVRFSGTAAGYYDNRYWTMWKLPMFGCTDASQVLREISECRRAYPQCYVRLAAFDSVKQVQVISFVVQRPSGSSSSSWGMAAMTGEKEMKVWNPVNNKKFETFSYLPPLSDAQIAKQVDMIIAKGLSPCLEFAAPENSFIANDNTVRFSGTAAGYYDNRYWTMWKLPMFGCTDASQVLREISECRRAYPQCYVRLAAFDSVKQVQVISFVVQRPSSGGRSW